MSHAELDDVMGLNSAAKDFLATVDAWATGDGQDLPELPGDETTRHIIMGLAFRYATEASTGKAVMFARNWNAKHAMKQAKLLQGKQATEERKARALEVFHKTLKETGSVEAASARVESQFDVKRRTLFNWRKKSEK